MVRISAFTWTAGTSNGHHATPAMREAESRQHIAMTPIRS